MTDAELKNWWPDMGTIVGELRHINRDDVADFLIDAVCAGTTSGEILDGIGVLLRDNRALRAELGDSGKSAWDSVQADLDRAYPGSKLGHWLARLTK